MPYNIDFHTHSIASPDGGITAQQYRHMLQSGPLDCVAVTDHNTLQVALELHESLGDKIIVGEEISTLEGELIGLFLTEVVPPQLSITETIVRIHQQGGLVYIPHPFETVRKGISTSIADAIAAQADIVEVYNGRAVFQNRSSQTRDWAAAHAVPGAASSDCHGTHGWGRTYTVLEAIPRRDTLITLLHDAQYHTGRPSIRGVLHPKLNRLKKWKATRHAG